MDERKWLRSEDPKKMLLYLKGALQRRLDAGEPLTDALLLDAIREGAVLRVRPKAMTVAVIVAGLVPIMIGAGTGSEVMQRIAAPMVEAALQAKRLADAQLAKEKARSLNKTGFQP